MTSINIKTANSGIIDAIKAIITLDSNSFISYENNSPELNVKDAKNLKEIIEADNHGKIKYLSEEDFKQNKKKLLKKLGANENYIYA